MIENAPGIRAHGRRDSRSEKRTCAVCGNSIEHLRSIAKFCGASCRSVGRGKPRCRESYEQGWYSALETAATLIYERTNRRDIAEMIRSVEP